MSIRIVIILMLVIWGSLVHSQINTDSLVQSNDTLVLNFPSDTIPQIDTSITNDTLGIPDSLLFITDSLRSPKRNYDKSPDALNDKVDYGSKGRKQIDLKNKIVHLWDDAYVNYQDIQVKGDYITFDFEKNLATAVATYDSSGHLVSKATFIEGETSFQYDYLKYNFKTEKGIVKQAVTQEGELFVHGAVTKFISAQDSTTDDIIYNKNAIVTSCNHSDPHYGIRTNKLKVVPEKLAIIGPSQLEIANVPTPLWLPFGFFPIMNGKSSGLILPKNYDFSPAWGFGIQNIGYYFPINDYFDAKVTGDIYLRGSWGINGILNYNKKYKYRGSMNFTRSSRRNEDLETGGYKRQISYSVRWTHAQDTKAHPYQNFSTSVNIKTAGFNRLNRTDARSVNTDNLNSTINYRYQFGESPWSFNGGAVFNQSLSARTVQLTLPQGEINMRQIFPFKKKVAIGKEKWYEKIGLTYNTNFKNFLEATDTTFYTADAWKDAKYGIKHSARTNASFKFLKYFSFNPSANYDEIWFFKEVEKSINDEIILDTIGQITENDITTFEVDTIYGEKITDFNGAFLPFRSGSVSAGVNTKLFWTEQWKKGFVSGFRHTITPSLSLNYDPDTRTPYERTYDTDFREDVTEFETYSVIPSGVFNASPRDANLGTRFSATNILEVKYYSKKDTTYKKKTLSKFSFGSNYNFVADSFNLSNPNLTGSSAFFNNQINLNYGFAIDPYKFQNGRRVDELFFQDELVIPTLRSYFLRSTTRLSFKKIRGWITGKDTENQNPARRQTIQTMSFGELFDNFNLNYKLDFVYNNVNGIVTQGITANTLNITGNLAITEKWAINLGQIGYDFRNKRTTYPSLGFSRDLHCWKMNFSWQPRGAAGFANGGNSSTFNFFIGVSSGTLDFLKYNYNRGNFDGGF